MNIPNCISNLLSLDILLINRNNIPVIWKVKIKN